ncbi:MAG TPA: hypothetical protein VMZ53_02830 [Kofleriaceae bacterium]|nr:hypothetical protein [Kofleriaceae bacterium]
MSRWRLLAFAFALAGCDSVFSVDHVGPVREDGGGGDADARGPDAMPDGPGACAPNEHDEDSDGFPDRCDGCPTVMDPDDADADDDGVWDNCDQNRGAGGRDAILFFAAFGGTDLDRFDIAGSVAEDPAGGGVATIANGSIMTKAMFLPTKIEILTAGLTGVDINDEARIDAPNAVCHIRTRTCGTSPTTGSMCVQMDASGGVGGQLGAPSGLLAVNLYRQGSNTFCYITANGMLSDAAPVVFTNGKLRISTTTGSTLSVKSVLVYGTAP